MLVAVVKGQMAKLRQIEIGPELTVDAPQHIEVEGGRHPSHVIIGGLQNRDRLSEVETQQEIVLGLECGRKTTEQLGLFAIVKITQITAQKQDQALPGGRQRGQAAQIVGGQAVDGQPGIVGDQPPGRFFQHGGADVDRDVVHGMAAALVLVQQQAGFDRAAAAQFDQAARADQIEQLGRPLTQQHGLGPGRIVFGLLADLLEQL